LEPSSAWRAARCAQGSRAKASRARRLAALTRAATSEELVPDWSQAMPAPAAARLPATSRTGAAAVYFPACVNRIFGNGPEDGDAPDVRQALVAVSARAGRPLWIPDDVAGHCCGLPWSSKGFAGGHEHMARKIADAAVRWTDSGRLPLVLDASSCSHGLIAEVAGTLEEAARERFEQIEVIDSIAWVHDTLLPALEVRRRADSVALHPPCAAVHLGLQEKLEAIARALSEEVVLPVPSTCCGTAGDRGLLHPELPAAALAPLAEELAWRPLSACLSSNRTCEIGLEQATGRPYRSFVLLLDELTRG
jgi:D-lactate dehydrogenase